MPNVYEQACLSVVHIQSYSPRCVKVPRSNLTKEQRTVLKELRGIKDEVILPADKGNATVMMGRCDYDEKMEEMLGAGTYGKLRGDPTATQENRLSGKLKGLEKRYQMHCTIS